MRTVSYFKNFLSALATLLMIASFTSCARSGETSKPDFKTGQEETLNNDLYTDAEVDAENLAEEGQELLGFETLDQARAKFEEALKLNPDNAQADIWKHFIAASDEFKGILGRLRPFIESLPNGVARYNSMMDKSLAGADQSYRRFISDGRGDITSAKEFQEWIDRMNLRFDDLRLAFRRHKNKEVRLLIPFAMLQIQEQNSFIAADKAGDCKAQSFGPIQYQPTDCDEKSAEFLLNRADLEAITIGLATAQSSLALMNAYQLDPSSLPLLEGDVKGATPFSAAAIAGAKLRSSSILGPLKMRLNDLAIGVKYLADHQNVACPKGRYAPSNRPGYLFPIGLCNESADQSATDRILRVINQIIEHRPLTITNERNLNSSIDFNLNAFIENPPTSLGDVVAAPGGKLCEGGTPNYKALNRYVSRGDLEHFVASFNPENKCVAPK